MVGWRFFLKNIFLLFFVTLVKDTNLRMSVHYGVCGVRTQLLKIVSNFVLNLERFSLSNIVISLNTEMEENFIKQRHASHRCVS